MAFRAKTRYLIQSVYRSGSYLRFESRKGSEMSQEELCDELRRIADLTDPRLKTGERTRRWNKSWDKVPATNGSGDEAHVAASTQARVTEANTKEPTSDL